MHSINEEIDIQVFEEKHYSLLEKWAKDVEQIPPPINILPAGYIIYINNEPVCMGFCYMDLASDVAFIEWVFFKKEASGKSKAIGLRVLLGVLKNFAILNQKEYIFTSTNYHGVSTILEKMNFCKITTGMEHFITRLDIKEQE